ncbi:hypothetical protein TRIUR3_30284 [Triticum urartu]|uniref:Uncharacterized protein n=1 Tax=Triticum urartu TaxID=4572 RepID=M7ZI40_TRIUA|nr:hypothetical protein TRIUR3_30284 [Triticum urartu]
MEVSEERALHGDERHGRVDERSVRPVAAAVGRGSESAQVAAMGEFSFTIIDDILAGKNIVVKFTSNVRGKLPGDGGGAGFAHGLVLYLPLTSGTDTLTSGALAPPPPASPFPCPPSPSTESAGSQSYRFLNTMLMGLNSNGVQDLTGLGQLALRVQDPALMRLRVVLPTGHIFILSRVRNQTSRGTLREYSRHAVKLDECNQGSCRSLSYLYFARQ